MRVPDQGQPAAPGGRGGPRFRAGIRLRPRGRLEARAPGGGGAGLQRHADHLQRLQGRRVHRDGDARPEDRAQRHPGGREVHRAGPDPEIRGEGGRAPADRHARQARRARRRPLAGLGRLPLQVRPDRRRSAARPRGAALARDGGLLQAPPLPPRQPDPQHPHRQGGAQRGGARLRRAGQGGRRAAVPRRRRRPRRGLRRLTDQLRVERQLHPRRVRQRRRLPHPDGVRRRQREAPDDRLGERPRHRRVSQRAGLQRPRRVGLRRGEDPRYHLAGRGRAAGDRPAADLPEPHGAERPRELSRRAAGARHGPQPVQRRLPAARAALPGREPLLGDPGEAEKARRADGRRPGRPAGTRRR